MVNPVEKPAPFAEMIRQAREAAKLTQAQLADAVGTTQQTIEKIELGKVKNSSFFPAIFSRVGLPLENLVTFRTGKPAKPVEAVKRAPPRKVYLKEWRKFMGAEPADLAKIAGGDSSGYLYLEMHPYKMSLEQLDRLATEIGIKPEQIWFPPKK